MFIISSYNEETEAQRRVWLAKGHIACPWLAQLGSVLGLSSPLPLLYSFSLPEGNAF
jgi:hypothetical protein